MPKELSRKKNKELRYNPIERVEHKNNNGSLSFGVKPKEAQEFLPEQATSDAMILQPNSPGRIESLDSQLTTSVEALSDTGLSLSEKAELEKCLDKPRDLELGPKIGVLKYIDSLPVDNTITLKDLRNINSNISGSSGKNSCYAPKTTTLAEEIKEDFFAFKNYAGYRKMELNRENHCSIEDILNSNGGHEASELANKVYDAYVSMAQQFQGLNNTGKGWLGRMGIDEGNYRAIAGLSPDQPDS